MPAPAVRPVIRRDASETPVAATRTRFAPLLGSLAILASTTTGEVAVPTTMPAVPARITQLPSRSARNS
jgi:hypothetical protein